MLGGQPDTSDLPPPAHLDDPDDDDDNGSQDAVERRRAAEHDARKIRLAEAWRSPGVTDPNSANQVEAQRQRWMGGR